MQQRDVVMQGDATDPRPDPRRTARSIPEGYRDDAHAVVIGINNYRDSRIPDLHYAVADAQRFHDVLTDPALGRFHPDNVALLLDADATERRIRSALATELPRRASADHTVCIFFAGHGAPVINPRTKSRDGLEKYLLPHDAVGDDLRSSAIPMEDINRFFDWIDTSQLIFFIDSCYSGVAGGRTFGSSDFNMRASVTDEFLDELAGEGRLVVTACATNEVALEKPDIGHGLFTYHLIEGLKGEADTDGDGFVTIDELYDYVYARVTRQARALGGSMSPMRKGFVKGSVYLAHYETPTVRRIREANAAAEEAFRQDDLDTASRLYREILDLDATNTTAREALEGIKQQVAMEKARLEEEARIKAEAIRRRRRALLEYRQSGALSMAIFVRAMELVGTDPDDLQPTDRMLREFTEALLDGQITPLQYVQSVELAAPEFHNPADSTPPVSEEPGSPADVEPRASDSPVHEEPHSPAEEEAGVFGPPVAGAAAPVPSQHGSASQPGHRAVSEPADGTVSEPGDDSVSEPGDGTASEPGQVTAPITKAEAPASPPVRDEAKELVDDEVGDGGVIDAAPDRGEPPVAEKRSSDRAATPTGPTSRPVEKRGSLARVLVITEVIAALTMAWLAWTRIAADPLPDPSSLFGFDPQNVAAVEIDLPTAESYSALEAIESVLRALPGIEAAGVSSERPLLDAPGLIEYDFGGPNMFQAIRGRRSYVSPGYFEALGVALLEGRQFTALDTLSPVAMLNDSPVFGSGVIGKQVDVDDSLSDVIGVVQATRSRFSSLAASGSIEPTVFLPYWKSPPGRQHVVVVRAAGSLRGLQGGESGATVAAIERAILAAVPGSTIAGWTSYEDIVAGLDETSYVTVTLLLLFFAAALLHAGWTIRAWRKASGS